MSSPDPAATLILTSECFDDAGRFETRYTGRGEDVSPELRLQGLDDRAKTLAVTLEDLTHPLFGTMAHWVAWNIPAGELIPGAIPPGRVSPGTGIVQGIAYGLHRYRGPKPPRGTTHTYRFTVYALDTVLRLSEWSRLSGLKRAIAGHVLQQAGLTGTYESRLRPRRPGA
ncbi:YbhB/YbcL family Raf kinase inhibitor-like protein [Actinomyces ruminicola]|uniref:YbhB/YbcL family Raf kinase inhibitor-like protein n=1 Tax=Actinomyces ruminicola TaxID=332524 RepID=UPI0011C959E0|nr:YbhB/YbcL family Raf kinase inhibitor-like protein [Actinomyces ruminicola]